MKHIVLLGDSIFDNLAYVHGGLDVVSHLRQKIPSDWEATLLAIDGDVVEDVRGQLSEMPSDATHLIVSAGGNNALMNADILHQRINSSTEFLREMADRASAFEYNYREMLKVVLGIGKPTAVCTIYYPNITDLLTQKIMMAALAVFNDVIIKQAFLAKVPLIDLRLVCNEKTDYANDIEPSEKGGGKIAETILKLVDEYDFEQGRTEIFY